jgi:hypothetical protein
MDNDQSQSFLQIIKFKAQIFLNTNNKNQSPEDSICFLCVFRAMPFARQRTCKHALLIEDGVLHGVRAEELS